MQMDSKTVGRSENPGGWLTSIMVDIIYPLVLIGLSDLPRSKGAAASPSPTAPPTALDSEARQMDVGKYVRLFGGEHLFQGLYNQSCQHLAVFLSFSFVSCFELSEGRHHYPRQPLNEASKEIHSSFIIAMTSSDQHEATLHIQSKYDCGDTKP